MYLVYERHELTTLKFRFKLDYVNEEYLPHIFIRHLITPEEAIVAFLNLSVKRYNNKHKRWEGYSEENNIYIYYMELKNNEIFIITAFNA